MTNARSGRGAAGMLMALALVAMAAACSRGERGDAPATGAQQADPEAPPDPHAHHRAALRQGASEAPEPLGALDLAGVELVDQHGVRVRFPDLLGDRVVVINSIFTTCTTICPPMGASFGRLAKALGDALGAEVLLVSISVDPGNDTPERLAAWAQTFHAGPGWILLTGARHDVDRALKSLRMFAAVVEDHTPLALVGHAGSNQWRRVSGLASTETMLALIAEARGAAQAASGAAPAASAPAGQRSSAAGAYFPDVELVDQTGRTLRFYSDLIAGKSVIISPFFASCTGTCVVSQNTLARLQDRVGERLGKDVRFLSITVDPEHDTPEVLAGLAGRLAARPGWYFLTGRKQDVDEVLRKLGQYVETREAHQNLFLIGNEPTGLWKKAFSLAPAADIAAIVASVIDDRGDPSAW